MLKLGRSKEPDTSVRAAAPTERPKYPGVPQAVDGSAAVVEMETAGGEAAGAYPITPSTQMGEGWAAAVAAGTKNVNGRRLIFFEPEGEHAAAAVTAGMSLTGLRSANFSSGQGVAYMHESLYAAVGKRLTYVLNMACRAMTKHSLNVHCGHDDYHSVDDTGFFQLFAKDVQESADLNLVAHRVAELSLNPGICAQDGFLTSHVIESMRMPEPELVREYLGDPADVIDSPTPAQRMVFGDNRRRIPELFDVDQPAMIGVVQNQDSYAQGVAAQRPFYFDHVADLTDRAFSEFGKLTGRRYERASGYRLDDAEYVIAGQGSVVPNAEAAADHLREKGVRVGVLNVRMFRPFPADLVTRLLRGKKAVAVLERTDQPLAVDAPLLREIRAAMSQALENGRAKSSNAPHPGVASYGAADAPEFFSGCFGMGSRDLQPADLVAAIDNMLPKGAGRRRFYLGVDFVRPGTRLPKLQIWQEKILEGYPHVGELSLPIGPEVNLLPKGAVAVRIHSVGGWGAITMGKNLTLTVFELLGLHVKANPKYGSEKKGQPTTFYAAFAPEPIRLNCELRQVDVVLSPDPLAFRNADPLAGMAEGGAFVIQSTVQPQDFWDSIPAEARRRIRQRNIRVFLLDGFKIAKDEASGADLVYRMQGAAFMGAFFRASPLASKAGLDETKLFEGIRDQLAKKFGKLGARVVEDNVRVVRRGFDEVRPLDIEKLVDKADEAPRGAALPRLVTESRVAPGIADPGRFFEQVCSLQRCGQDPLADPFTAISAIPAATGTFRDMTDIRQEVPKFLAEKCTGCGQCWTQCPDTAIPGLVSEVEDVLRAAISAGPPGGGNGRKFDRLPQIVKHLGAETRKLLRSPEKPQPAEALAAAYPNVAAKLGLDAERRAALDAEFAAVQQILVDLPLARTQAFFDLAEAKQKDSGGLLSVTVNPAACKGCNLCVDVCPDGALVAVPQTDDFVARLRRGWDLWEKLPDTHPRYVNVTDMDEGIGVLSTLLLRKATYRSMVGGDGACMGCGEKTSVHLITAAVRAAMQPHVARMVEKLDSMITSLDGEARKRLAAGADLDAAGAAGHVDVDVAPENRERLARLTKLLRALRDLRWRYVEGPSGRGRAELAMANSTGCSSVWASTFPLNPYPFPWVNHLFQDAPSVAIGVFEGHMRKMADAFATVRRAELELAGSYDPATSEKEFEDFDWRRFTDDEMALCPPIFAMGGDGAMLDIGFQNVSRLLASGKPIRVIMLDTQVYSNTGGQACTSGFTGQVSDMAGYGPGQHGKEETRKEMALLAIAHRGAFVLQSSQAAPAHLIGGVLKGLRSRRPAMFVIYTPCPVEHGIADDAAARAARLALESRAFPHLVYDPGKGGNYADCLDLDANPAQGERWPTYDLQYVDEAGAAQRMSLPVTIADWAATESRFGKHFKKVKPDAWTDEMVPFHEYVDLSREDREGKTPFLHVLGADRRLGRMTVSQEMVLLAEDRLAFWSQLRQLAGLEVAPSVRDGIQGAVVAEYEKKLTALRAEYEAKLADLRATYPPQIARRLAEAVVRAAGGSPALTEFLEKLPAAPPGFGAGAPMVVPAAPAPAPAEKNGHAAGAPAAAPAAPVATATAVAEPAAGESGDLTIDPYIDTERCTSCNECVNANKKLFAYNDKKQAFIKDARGGTFRELVQAAEKCPVSIIHPGTPLNPAEKDLAKWVKRAERFK